MSFTWRRRGSSDRVDPSRRRIAPAWRLLSVGVAGVIALFLLLPAEALAGTFERGVRWLAGLLGGEPRRMAAELPWDRIVHGLLFAVLAWVWCRPFARSGRIRGVAAAAAGAVAYGAAIELVQIQVGYRSGEWMDLVADAIGAAVGALFAAGAWPRPAPVERRASESA